MTDLKFGSIEVEMFIPGESCAEIVYLHAAKEEGRRVWELLSHPRPMLAVISGTDWNRDFSPWPAPKVFARGEDFSGGGEAHLSRLSDEIIPHVECILPCPVQARCIAGYSLAGLFALWCTYRCNLFDAVAALSPSLWYDGFGAFMKENRPQSRLKRVVMSLGDREKHTRNPRIACIEECFLKAAEQLRNAGTDVHFSFERGGHFDDPTGRIARGIGNLRPFIP